MAESGVFRSFLNTFLAVRKEISKSLASSFLTVVFMALAYLFVQSLDSGSLTSALFRHFIETHEQAVDRQRDEYSEKMKRELLLVQISERAIDDTIQRLLKSVPNAARVRVDIIHNGTTGITGVNFLKYDVVAATAAPGRQKGELPINQPLGEWNDYLSDLIARKCVFRNTSASTNITVSDRIAAMGIKAVYICPIYDRTGLMLGALFLSWDLNDPLPSDLGPVDTLVKNAANEVAAAYNMRIDPGG